jgi:hypothetical protein
MTTITDYKKYAQECIQSARSATSDPVRKQFLELAKLWMTAAGRMAASSSSSSKTKKGDGYALRPGSTLEPQ